MGADITHGIDFAVILEVEEPPAGEEVTTAGPNAAAQVSLDLNSASGNQDVTTLEAEAGETVELAIYGRELSEVTGISLTVSFDTTQVAFAEAVEAGDEESHLLRSKPGAIVLFLPPRLQENTIDFAGAILSATENTAAAGEGLLGVLRFTTLEEYTGASLALEKVIFNALGGIQDTLQTATTALVTPPLDLLSQPRGIFSFDFDSNESDNGLFHLGEVSPGDEVQAEIYINDAEKLTNLAVTVLYDPEQLSYVTFADGDFLASGGASPFSLTPLLFDNTVEFGSAIFGGGSEAIAASGSGRVGTLTFAATESFTETDLIIIRYSTKAFGGEQERMESSLFARISQDPISIRVATSGGTSDFNGDGVVDFTDFFQFADAFGQPATGGNARFDLDGNGQIDFGDFFQFADAFGTAVAKAGPEKALPSVDGSLELAASSTPASLRIDLRSEDLSLRGYSAILAYDPELFGLLEVVDAKSQLRADGRQALLLTEEAPGEVLLLGSRTSGSPATPGLLAELYFEPLTAEATGMFCLREAMVRRAEGELAQPSSLGAIEARWVPQGFCLEPNYPNPFNPSTTIRYQLPSASKVRLEIYDVLGQKVRTLVSESQPAGYLRVAWDGRDEQAVAVAAGVYLYHLQAGEFSQVRKLLLLK